MTDEELRQRMEFIVEQQAQLVVNQQKAEERLMKSEGRQEKTEERPARLEDAMSNLAESQARMSRAQEHMNEVVVVMAEAQTRTDERLDAFIGALERYISEGRNGNSE
ncbi:MAG TPA: hypothetical protein VJT09_16340 [Pyrinomonadaceae bacterium]|nr:hypothetical protein [Pyrinomonadaceae bacterium]